MRKLNPIILLSCVVLTAAPPLASAVVLLHNDFTGGTLDTALWHQPTGPGSFLGRTQMRPPSLPPVIGGGFLRLALDTFNPTARVPGDSFYGTEIRSNRRFARGDGLAFEARARFAGAVPGGLVGGIFSFDTNGFIRDELTFELLSNDLAAGRQRVLSNAFDNDSFSQPGDKAFVSIPALDLTAFNNYRIEWLPDRVRWRINDRLVREESTTVPDQAMRVHLNLWAPDHFFAEAFDAALQPVASAAANQRYTLEVDSVTVERPTTAVAEPNTLWLGLTGISAIFGVGPRRRGAVAHQVVRYSSGEDPQ